jgi:hypothetical protein
MNGAGLPWPASLLLGCACRLMPAERGEWARAMRAESHHLPRDAAFSWAAGCLIAAVKQRFSPMDTGNFRINRRVMLIEILGCFGPATLAWWEFTFGASGAVRLNSEIIDKVFFSVPGGAGVFALWIGLGVAGLVGLAGLFLGLRYVISGRPLRSRLLGFSLITLLVLYSVAATIGLSWAGAQDFALRADMFLLMTLLPAAGIAHLMYLAKPPAALPVDARLAAS